LTIPSLANSREMGRGAVNEEEHRGEGCPAEFRLDPEIQRVW